MKQVVFSLFSGKFDGKPVEYNNEECQVIRDDNVLLAYQGVTMRLDNVIPIRDYVLVKLKASSEESLETASGVMIAGQVMKDSLPCTGTVTKVGEGRLCASGDFTPSPVQEGDEVKFKDYAGNDVVIEGENYSVVKMVDILSSKTA